MTRKVKSLTRTWLRHVAAIAAAIVTTALSATVAVAQQDTGIIVGSVPDTDNAVLPGVSVTVVNQTTAVSVTVTTNERGQYRTPPLRIGTYNVIAELQGFKRFDRQGVPLSIGDVRNVDAVLSVGDLQESITVEGTLPVLNTSDSTVGTVLSNDKPQLPETIKLWNGDSRARWDGNTLVVDVTNNNSKWRLARTGEFVSDQATIVERWTFANDGTRFVYDATYTDPTVLTRPFTITIPVKRVQIDTPPGWDNETMPAEHDGREAVVEMWERSCYEGNAAHSAAQQR